MLSLMSIFFVLLEKVKSVALPFLLQSNIPVPAGKYSHKIRIFVGELEILAVL